MEISKEAKGLGMPWEGNYGYSQAVKVGYTIYLSGENIVDEVLFVTDMDAALAAVAKARKGWYTSSRW